MSGDLTRKRRRLALIIGGGFAAAGVLYWIYKRRKGDANDDHGANRPPAEGGWEIVDRGEDNVLSPAAPAGRDDTTPHQLLTSMLSKESLLPTLKDKKVLYTDYIARQRHTLDNLALQRYCQQLQLVTDLCSIVQRDPLDANKVIELMQASDETVVSAQQLQNAGDPPEDLDLP